MKRQVGDTEDDVVFAQSPNVFFPEVCLLLAMDGVHGRSVG